MQNNKNDSAKFRLRWGIRLAGSAVVLGLTLWLLPTREVWRTVRNVEPALWLFVLTVYLLGHLVAATKWWLLTSRNGDVVFSDALKAHFAGLMANLCLPGAVGGDVVRASLIVRQSQKKSRIAVGAVVDRLLDSLGLFLLSCAGAMFALEGHSWLESPLLKLAIVFLAGASLIALFVFVLARLPQKAIVEKLREALAEFRKEPGRLLLCFGMSIVVQSAFVGLNIALATAGGVHVSAAVWFFAWPLAKVISTLPISIGGLGVREASLAAFMARFGAVPAQVVGAGLLWQTVLFAGGLIGGLTWLMSARLKLSPVEDSQR